MILINQLMRLAKNADTSLFTQEKNDQRTDNRRLTLSFKERFVLLQVQLCRNEII